ncbi:MAG: CBS domain-containing protein [Ferruginibacter sp.]
MLTANLINTNIPRLKPQDSLAKALQLISDFKVTHLPVVSDGKFLGLICEEDLLDVEEQKVTIEVLQEFLIQAAVDENAHFLIAVNCSIQFDTNVVPVISQSGEYIGVITTTDLLKALANFSGANEIGGIIVLEMERSQFAISEISRIVESNDCTILHLNTTVHPESGMLTVTIHINKREISTVIATFERYDYHVSYNFGVENFENEIDNNYRNFMHYLDI